MKNRDEIMKRIREIEMAYPDGDVPEYARGEHAALTWLLCGETFEFDNLGVFAQKIAIGNYRSDYCAYEDVSDIPDADIISAINENELFFDVYGNIDFLSQMEADMVWFEKKYAEV